ncbi:hypothetical protein L3V79_00420 [Thiotrichales bacterium 19S9-12]|nr:hypothetical protein [Thiotrichales bacterium 19S9-11]MCF6810829.1 hypothetical protein [Thiotrichales bacterium 19S9-12]
MLRNISYAFTSGIAGAILLCMLVHFLFGFSNSDQLMSSLLKVMAWSSLWSLLLVIPILDKKWLLRAAILSSIVILFNFVVLMPLNGMGFFASNASLAVQIGNVIFNLAWCYVATYWYYRCKMT